MIRYGSLVYDSTEFVTVQLKVTSELFIMEPLIAYGCMFAAVNFSQILPNIMPISIKDPELKV